MKKFIPILVAAISLSGCGLMPPVTHRIAAKFDSKHAENQMRPGSGTISGTAFLRQQGGGVVTCAAQDVNIIPVTAYATERLKKLYGMAPSVGKTAIRGPGREVRFEPDVQKYKELAKQTKCDAQGEFLFEGVKDGLYYISTLVVWQAGAYNYQGGTLITQVRVQGGRSPRVIMSP